MKTKSNLILMALLLLWQSGLFGQCEGVFHQNLDGNNVRAQINNGGDMFWDLGSSPVYEVPKGSGQHVAFGSALWMGGLDNQGNLHVAAQTYRQAGHDYFPGPVRSTGAYSCVTGFQPTITVNQILALSTGKVMFIGPTGYEVYDPGSGALVTGGFPTYRNFARGLELADGRILVYGDLNGGSKEEIYYIDGTTFGLNPTSVTLTDWHAYSEAIQLTNGQVLIAGFQGCELLDPSNNNLFAVPSLGTPRVRFGMTLLPGGNVFVSGGSTSLGGSSGLTTTEIYNTMSNTWTPGATMSTPRVDHSALLLSSGEVFLAGSATPSGVVEHYNPVSNTFTQTISVSQLVGRNTCAELPNGNVVLMFEPNGSVPQLNTYIPGFSTLIEGNLNRLNDRAVVLANGNLFQEFEGGFFKEVDISRQTVVGEDWQYIWKVSKDQIVQFLADFQNNTVDFSNYPDIETWPAHGNVTLGEDYLLAPFIDANNDGLYDPVNSGDYPCIQGDQALWWVFNDDAGLHTETGGDALGMQVETMAYVYDCQTQPCNNTAVETTTFYHYELTNKSPNAYTDFYFSVWTDSDLGNFSDDYVGCDSARGMGFCYNGDAVDGPGPGSYGTNPPAVGTRFLETPGPSRLSNFMYYENDFSPRGNPAVAGEYYNLMRSIWRDSTPLTFGGNGYGGTQPANFMFTGDGGWCGGPASGWSEVSENNQPFDRRYVQSFGPIDLAPGETVEFDVAVVYARAFVNDNLGSVCELLQASDSVKSWFDNQPQTCFDLMIAREEPMALPDALTLYPNPTSGGFKLALEQPQQLEGQLSLSDQLGRVVFRQQVPLGIRELQVQPGSLSDGLYLVELRTGDQRKVGKLLVRH